MLVAISSSDSQKVTMASPGASQENLSDELYDQPKAETDSGIQSPCTPNQRYKALRQSTYPEQSSPLPGSVSTYPPRQSSLPTTMGIETNGIFSPQPLTTSQHHPPKIRMVDRRPAVNLSSPTPTDSSSQPSSAEDLQQSTAYLSEETLAVSKVGRKPLDERSASEDSSTGASSGKSTDKPPLQKDSSFDYYKDSSGIDLHEFIVRTLRENPRDRLMLLKLEKDFNDLVCDPQQTMLKYPAMTSYHRMLVHRVAAYFGLEHNVDSSGKCVVVNKTSNSRIPERSFQTYCSREYTDEELSLPKAILRRGNTTSSEEGTQSPRPGSPLVSRRTMEDKKSKSIEERTEEYNKARERIFNQDSTASSQSSGDGQDQLLLTPVQQLVAVNAATTPPTVPPPDATTGRPGHWPPRLQALEQQKNAERNAALAATAALTGGKVPQENKRFSEKNQKFPLPQAMSGYAMPLTGDGSLGVEQSLVSYPAGVGQQVAVAPGAPGHSQPGLLVGLSGDGIPPGSLVLNPATGAPLLGPDGLPLIYQSGYFNRGGIRQVSPGTILYAAQPTGASAQPSPYQLVMPMPQVGAPQHYVVLQQPGQQSRGSVAAGPQDVSGVQASVGLHAYSQALNYQDLSSQIAAMSLSPRTEGAEEEPGSSDTSYSATSPTAEAPQPVFFSSPQGQYFVIPQQGRPLIPSQMYHGQAMPSQFLSAQRYPAYTQSQYLHYSPGEHTNRYSQSRTPPGSQRSTSPVVMAPQYLGGTPPPSQPPYTRASSAQTPPFQRTPPPSQVQQYIRGIFQPSVQTVQGVSGSGVYSHMASSQIHYTGAQLPQQQLVAPAQTSWRGHPGNKKGNKSGDFNVHGDSSHYRPLLSHDSPRVQSTMGSFPPQPRPLVTMIPFSPYSHIQSNRFFPSHSPYGQFMTQQPMHRKSRPRAASGSHKTGSSRSTPHSTSSSSSDQDNKTVNHILEVYDLPEDLSPTETDNMLVDLRTAGGRILRINNSSSQNGQASACPTVLAIFKSAGEAQCALETVKNPSYKLRVSLKSPTHFPSDSSLNRSSKVGTTASSSSSSPST